MAGTAFIGKIATSPQAQKAFKQGVSMGLSMIKQHRQQRQSQGKKVFGRGRALNVVYKRRQGRSNNRRDRGLSQKNTPVPVTNAATVSTQNIQHLRFDRTELTLDVMSASNNASLDTRVTIIPLYGTNPDVDPAAVGTAASFGYYKFKSFRWLYRPAVSTAIAGQIMVTWVATYEMAKNITDIATAAGSNGTQIQPYVPTSPKMVLPSLSLNTNFLNTSGWLCKEEQDVDEKDPAHVQGYLVITRGDGAGGEPIQWGTISINYNIEFLKPQAPTTPLAVSLAAWIHPSPATADWVDEFIAENSDLRTNQRWRFSKNSDTGGLDITTHTKVPFLLYVHCSGTITADPFTSLTCANAEIVRLGANFYHETVGVSTYLIYPHTSTTVFNITPSACLFDLLDLDFHSISRAEFARLVELREGV